jgi:phenylalanine-4-hydroxylase
MEKTIDRLPDHLKVYVVDQKYQQYTPRDQACWRHIMRQSRDFFANHAHPIYLEGMKKTGVSFSSIPKITDMDNALRQFGWGAVCVSGFIPPAAFLEFQARKVLAIAADMRTVEHMAYTPAPDIVHEAAGHAPIVADPDYADYLTRYAQLAQKAIYSIEDIEVFEAIRVLSDLKENPDTTPDQIAKAEANLKLANSNIIWISEASQVARMAWWTVEYGLVKYHDDIRIFGAGLLSSVGESQNFLSDKVKKIPFSIDCIHQSYDITEPQPQLFVVDHFEQLNQVLSELEGLMAYKHGGVEGLNKAIKSKAITTSVLDSRISVSGTLDRYLLDGDGQPCFLKWSGPVQLCHQDLEIEGQGKTRHPHGFSSPIGRWALAPDRFPQDLKPEDLEQIGVKKGKSATLGFTSGANVTGTLKQILYKQDKLILMTWENATLTFQGETLFHPDWGDFDMLVGTTLPSVYGGPADIQSYGPYDIGKASTSPVRQSPYSDEEWQLFSIYEALRGWREQVSLSEEELEARLAATAEDMIEHYPNEWLLGIEILELANQCLSNPPGKREWEAHLVRHLSSNPHFGPDLQKMIKKGLELASQLD